MMAINAVTAAPRGHTRPSACCTSRASKAIFKPDATTIWTSPLAIICCSRAGGSAAR